ncbi:MAG: hypothetical protein K0B52_01100 [FCB group bacterium]|nr:hypothetical protein [FCB group bacterium]
MYKYAFLFFAFFPAFLSAGDTLFFDVTIFGVRAAAVEITENRLPGNVNEIVYHAFTVGAFDKIYAIDNWYYYYTDTLLSRMDSLKKIIRQHDLQQEYEEHILDGTVRYTGSAEQTIATPLHHVLSFLIYLQNHPEKLETGTCFPFQISDEGDLYQPYITVYVNKAKRQREVFFSFSKTGGREILEPTDVFNWMICSGKGDRMLAYSMDDNTIVEGVFSIGWGLRLKAKRRT